MLVTSLGRWDQHGELGVALASLSPRSDRDGYFQSQTYMYVCIHCKSTYRLCLTGRRITTMRSWRRSTAVIWSAPVLTRLCRLSSRGAAGLPASPPCTSRRRSAAEPPWPRLSGRAGAPQRCRLPASGGSSAMSVGEVAPLPATECVTFFFCVASTRSRRPRRPSAAWSTVPRSSRDGRALRPEGLQVLVCRCR